MTCAVDSVFRRCACFCPRFIFIFAINLQQWEKKMLKEDLVISLIKLFKRMSIAQNVEKRKCDSDYFYSLFSLRQGHETFQYYFSFKLNETFLPPVCQ